MAAPTARTLLAFVFLTALGSAPTLADTSSLSSSGAPPAERVVGIGGFFFRADHPAVLAQWYWTHLGINLVPQTKDDPVWQQQAGQTVFAPFRRATSYWKPPTQQWMINFRVSDLTRMAAQLKAAGIAVDVDPVKYPNGRFAHLKDPEGNPIELWEPSASPWAPKSSF